MLNIFSAKQAKQAARVLERFLTARGHELKLGHALEALAQMSGNKNWAALSQQLTEEVANRELSPMELEHAEDNQSNDYGEECALVAHTGFELRYGAKGDGVDYVRVCDPLGREVAYWVDDEWRDDPQVVMGAIIGALVRGRPVEVGVKADKQASAAASPPVPKIQDVPFQDVGAVWFNDDYRNLQYLDADQLSRIYKDPMPAPEDDPDDIEHETVFVLERNDDGLIYEEQVSVATLRSLTWDAAKKYFIDPQTKDTYRFLISREFGA